MKICIVDRGASIPVTQYGGTERVIWGLGKELSNLGHEVTFLVPPGSHSDFARVLPLDLESSLEVQIPEDIDVVHMNWEPSEKLTKPFVVTMHGNPAPTDVLHPNTIFISQNQAARHNSNVFVHNGLLWEDYPKPDLKTPRDSFHFLGKASWKVKNAVGAKKISKRLNCKLHIIGGKRWTERNLKTAFPFLLSRKVKFHGLLDNTAKSRVMQNSKALIFPVLWHEPFGLAVIESLYAGCAVFSTANGSLPELIPADCGFTSNSSRELAAAIENFDFNPQRCHDYAVENFNARLMAERYMKYYELVLAGEKLHTEAPAYNHKLNEVPEYI